VGVEEGGSLLGATTLDPMMRLTVAEAMQLKFIVSIKQPVAAQQSALCKQNQ
jgi:hypothetical protein